MNKKEAAAIASAAAAAKARLAPGITRKHYHLYRVWCAMKERCSNPKDSAFKNYGGRGIKVCERWRKFDAFVTDVGLRPADSLLDRIDNDGNYEPSNCRWRTRKEQNSNRRNCIYVTLSGETMTLKEACRRKGLKYRAVHKRIQDRGWDVERALSTPIGIGNSKGVLNAKSRTIRTGK